ncbi:MAG: head-tail connector protein [Patescibacteria group bacterium]|nr:head-tail connector protein [Patescibacteria group bacterium]
MTAATNSGVTKQDQDYYAFVIGRLLGMRVNRYSWWTHWRELADYFLPRRYKWIITPNQMARGSPINQHIIDDTGTFAARNLAAGMMSGKSSPTRQWFKLRFGHIDSTQTSPVSLWLAECERIMRLVFQESNFYNSMAQFYYDLVIFGTATMIIYEDFHNVINCYNPCAGEYYVDIDGRYWPAILYREFTMTVAAVVDEFGYDNCSATVRNLYDTKTSKSGANLTREIIVAHAIEPNTDERDFGIPKRFKYREVYWEWGGSTSPQSGTQMPPAFLRKKGYHEQPHVTGRWDLVSNDPYGRSPAMDALGDQKQLQLETKRKAQAIDKMVNPPLVADVQLKNQPASLLPGGMTYVSGFAQSGKAAIASIYDTKFPINEIVEDLTEVKDRIKKCFFNDLFQTASQFETRSNVTELEWNMRKSESMIMLGPVLERIDYEVLKPAFERSWAIGLRAGIFPPAPAEIQGKELTISFDSMLAQAQNATQAGSIQQVLSLIGELAGVDPSVMDNVDIDYTVDKYSSLLNNDPKMIRSPEALAQIRQQRQQDAQQQQQAAMAEQLAKGAHTLSQADVGGGQNALQAITGGAQ